MKKIRNKETGKIYEIADGAIYPEWAYEVVKDDDIKVGEPKVEVEFEETEESAKEAEAVAEKAEEPAEKTVEETPKTSTKKSKAKKPAKGVKKDEEDKRD